MPELIFFFSGENLKLGEEELMAVAQAYNIDVEIAWRFKRIAGCRLNFKDYSSMQRTGNYPELIGIEKLSKRLAFTKAIYSLLGSCKNEENEILELFREIQIDKKIKSFCVRVRKLEEDDFSSIELQEKIGRIIKERTKAKVNLETPEALFQCFAGGNKFLASLLLKEIKHDFSEREPNKRPCFHPSTMKPKLARAIVNLTRIKEGERFLDPFCGVGGMLIEAGLMGAEVYGIDKDKAMVDACEKNLEYYGIKAMVEQGDAREIGEKYKSFFHAIACDPPYGRSSSTLGEKAEKLYRESLKSIYRALAENRYACILAPEKIEAESFAEEAGFKVKKIIFWRAHKSLTRKICVLQKD